MIIFFSSLRIWWNHLDLHIWGWVEFLLIHVSCYKSEIPSLSVSRITPDYDHQVWPIILNSPHNICIGPRDDNDKLPFIDKLRHCHPAFSALHVLCLTVPSEHCIFSCSSSPTLYPYNFKKFKTLNTRNFRRLRTIKTILPSVERFRIRIKGNIIQISSIYI